VLAAETFEKVRLPARLAVLAHGGAFRDSMNSGTGAPAFTRSPIAMTAVL
jgi:hypothetical protein